VWKIYGCDIQQSLAAIKDEGIGKAEVFGRFECVVAVADVSFSVTPGEVFCIMGLSGSGKSTLLRHLNRLIEPTSGKILIHGENIQQKNPAELRRLRVEKIGMVFQNMALFPHLSVRDNVAYGLKVRGMGRKERRDMAEEKLDLVQLEGWGDRYPDELSGGMQQRVGLARALAVDPDILLLDEPFSALDPLIRRQLQEQFQQISSAVKKTAIFITHDLDEAIRLGHRIAIMKDGYFVQVGTPEDIVTNPMDDYVAEFIKGISKLKIVHARAIMEPLEAYAAGGNEVPLEECPRARADTDLDHLVDLASGTDNPIVVVNEEAKPIGVITKRSLLRGIQGTK
jgi:glycine betaine/proline transport system ATP-binding protein